MTERNPADELDDALNGPIAVPDEVAPLLDAAVRLRAELTGVQLSLEARRRHLGELMGPTVSSDQPRRAAAGTLTRRRIVAAVLAAAIALAAVGVVVSARSVPGQPLHPVKLAVEDARLAAVAFSPQLAAREWLRLVGVRTGEAVRLNAAGDRQHLPAAVFAACDAMYAASAAVAAVHGAHATSLRSQLRRTWTTQAAALDSVATHLPAATPPADRTAIDEAVMMVSAASGSRSPPASSPPAPGTSVVPPPTLVPSQPPTTTPR